MVCKQLAEMAKVLFGIPKIFMKTKQAWFGNRVFGQPTAMCKQAGNPKIGLVQNDPKATD